MSVEDLRIERFGITVPGAPLKNAIDPLRDAFIGVTPSEDWDRVFDQSEEAAKASNPRAYMLPATRFLLLATIRVLELEEVSPQLPLEISDRAVAPGVITEHVISEMKNTNGLEDAYKQRGIFSLGSELDRAGLSNPATIEGLVAHIFNDARSLVGGAYRLLRAEHEACEEEPTEVIKRSGGLLIAANIAHRSSLKVYDYLGRPYTYSDRLEIKQSGGLRVGFRLATLEFLRDYLGCEGDCPARTMKAPGKTGSILQSDWKEIVSYLAPPNATVATYREPAPTLFRVS